MTVEKRKRAKPENAGRDQGGRFRPGQSGNPRGKPSGTRHRATMAAEALLDGQAEALTKKAVELALGGDLVALRLCLERILPPRRDRPLDASSKISGDIQTLPVLTSAIVNQVLAGEVTPNEGVELVKIVEIHRSTIETADLAERIDRLEATR